MRLYVGVRGVCVCVRVCSCASMGGSVCMCVCMHVYRMSGCVGCWGACWCEWALRWVGEGVRASVYRCGSMSYVLDMLATDAEISMRLYIHSFVRY